LHFACWGIPRLFHFQGIMGVSWFVLKSPPNGQRTTPSRQRHLATSFQGDQVERLRGALGNWEGPMRRQTLRVVYYIARSDAGGIANSKTLLNASLPPSSFPPLPRPPPLPFSSLIPNYPPSLPPSLSEPRPLNTLCPHHALSPPPHSTGKHLSPAKRPRHAWPRYALPLRA